ncbi:MAG: bactofilin family protein [Gemmatimonadales bacterium]
MGLFSTSSNAKVEGAAPVWERRRKGEAGGLSIVARDLTVTGDLEAAGVIRIEGRVQGNVHAGDQLLLSEGGIIQGSVTTREAVIGGTVHGSITGSERVELQAQAVVEGDIITRRLVVAEGGTVNGSVRMETVNGEER